MNKLSIILLLLSLSFASAGQSVDDLIRAGNIQYAKKDYNGAFQLYARAANQNSEQAAMKAGKMIYRHDVAIDDYHPAYEWFLKWAQAENKEAMVYLARILETGYNGVSIDFKKSRYWYEKAAEKGDSLAVNELGLFYETGMDGTVQRDYFKAAEQYQRSADMGNSNAYINLGSIYAEENLPVYDIVKAESALKRAVAAGNPEGYVKLAELYSNTHSLLYDNAKAIGLLKLGVQKKKEGVASSLAAYYTSIGKKDSATLVLETAMAFHDVQAMFSLASMYKTINENKRTRILQLAAGEGSVNAMTELGDIYLPNDVPKAIAYFDSACRKGSAYAFFQLNSLYGGDMLKGEIIPEKARMLLNRFIAYNSAAQLCSIGYRLQTRNEGNIQDLYKAKVMYEAAAARGHQRAVSNLGSMYCEGLGVERDYKKAIQLYENAMEKGSPEGTFNLALMYINGEGMDYPDISKGIELYERAINYGSADAAWNLAQIYHNGTKGKTVDIIKAKQIYAKAAAWGDLHSMNNLAFLWVNDENPSAADIEKAGWYFKACCDLSDELGCENYQDYLQARQSGRWPGVR